MGKPWIFMISAEYDAIRNYSLAQLICENTFGMELVQADIFQFKWVDSDRWSLVSPPISAPAKCSAVASLPSQSSEFYELQAPTNTQHYCTHTRSFSEVNIFLNVKIESKHDFRSTDHNPEWILWKPSGFHDKYERWSFQRQCAGNMCDALWGPIFIFTLQYTRIQPIRQQEFSFSERRLQRQFNEDSG